MPAHRAQPWTLLLLQWQYFDQPVPRVHDYLLYINSSWRFCVKWRSVGSGGSQCIEASRLALLITTLEHIELYVLVALIIFI